VVGGVSRAFSPRGRLGAGREHFHSAATGAGRGPPDTLTTANNLALDLHALDEVAEARELDENTHVRYQSMLGDDNLDALVSA
jgi:hypothetical protein